MAILSAGRVGRTGVLALGSVALLAAAQHIPRIYRNAAIEIRAIAEGPDGIFWLAAADGLYRFDGLHYDKVREFPLASARFLGFTDDGTLWIGGEQGLLRYDGRFRTVLSGEIRGMAVGPGWVAANRTYLYRVSLDGSTEKWEGEAARRDILPDSNGSVWYSCGLEVICMSSVPVHGPRVEYAARGDMVTQGFRDANGTLWAADDEQAGTVEGGQRNNVFRRLPRPGLRPGPLFPGRNGQLWLIGETTKGVTPPLVFAHRKAFASYPPTAAYEDTRGHLWVAHTGLGLVEWTPQANWERWFSEEFRQQAITQVVRSANGETIASTALGLYRLVDGTWVPLPGSPRTAYLLPEEDGGFFASVRKVGVARLTPSGQIRKTIPNPAWHVTGQDVKAAPDNFRILGRDLRGRLWAGNKVALTHLEGPPSAPQLHEIVLPEAKPNRPGTNYLANAVDLDLDGNGDLWVGYEEGLAWLDRNDRWRRIRTSQPVEKVRSFALAGDRSGAEIWVAYRHAGPFSRLVKKGEMWNVTDYAPEHGYGPPDTYFVKRDSRGWIWRGTTDGVYVSDGRHFGPADWIHLSPDQGLAVAATDQYSFFEDRDGSIWIGGKEGVSHVHPRADWFEAPHTAPAPRVVRVEAESDAVRFEAGSLQLPPFRDYPLEYRLMPKEAWWPSRDGTLEFRGLAAGAYTLQVRYPGSGASPTSAVDFTIERKPLGLWMAGLLITGALLALLLTSWRTERLRYRVLKELFLLRRRFGGAAAPAHREMTGFQDLSGQTVAGRYRLRSILARGGSSIVYDARDTANDEAAVVVKILSAAAGTASATRSRFAQEVATLRSVEHPGIVPILDSWMGPGGEPCLVMPMLDGPTLRGELAGGPLPAARVGRIVRQLGSALAEAHNRGIVHRDLKPENIMLVQAGTESEQAVIIDFGTAAFRGPEHALATTTQLSGSFHYLAPERLAGRFSAATDLYAFGVIVLEMLTTRRLSDLGSMYAEPGFTGELERVLSGPLGSRKAAELARTLTPAYAPQPRDRPPDADLWALDVEAALRNGPS
jgi:ligand-binding sensor domain-containing protein